MTQDPPQWTALVLAGQRPGPDRLAAHFGESWKALVKVGGEAMLTRVVRALALTPEVGRIVILAQSPEALANAAKAGGRAEFARSGGGISASILAVAGSASAPFPLLVTTADHPLLTPALVSGFIRQSAGCDLAIGMVERAAMRAAFPENRRTWLKFRDGHWSGANLFALNTARVSAALKLWARAEQDRKTAWKLFLHFGPMLALRALTRTIGLGDALTRAGARLGLAARLAPIADATAAIDVDKLSDWELAERILADGGPA